MSLTITNGILLSDIRSDTKEKRDFHVGDFLEFLA